MQTFIRIHPKDSVAVALQPLSNGTVIRLDDLQFTLKEDIPQGHKFALLPISAGAGGSKKTLLFKNST